MSNEIPAFTLALPAARPLTTVDVVIFTVRHDALCVLLTRRPPAAADPAEPFPGALALPGGFLDPARDEDLAACARRKLREKTGVDSPYLEQLGSWGSRARDPRGWSATHVYFALVASERVVLEAGGNAADVSWHAVDDPGLSSATLAFDHHALLTAATDRLRSKVEYTSLAAHLLAEPFTLPQLQHIHEVVLGRALDKSAFRTRVLAAGFLQEAGPQPGTSRRPAMGYCIRAPHRLSVFPRTFRQPGRLAP